ncbi:MAG: Ig-like domain-containing protein [Rhodanobacter sp.]
MAVVLSRVTLSPQIGAIGESGALTLVAIDGAVLQAGLTINWAVTVGDATLSAPTSVTAADGVASITVTFGSTNSTVTGTYAVSASSVSWALSSQINYNCACDDVFETRTLLQMRTYLAIRLGMASQINGLAPGVALELDSFLRDAQEQIYEQLKLNRMSRYFTWQLEPGVRFYDFSANLYQCTKKLNPDMLEWVGISQNGNFWRPLVSGINPAMYYSDVTGWPQYYAIRQCIEIWPTPQDATWQLRILGQFGLMPLEAETDSCTIDYRMVQLFALANAKAHRGQPDAANYMQQYRALAGKVVAGQYGLTRFVPGAEETAPPPLPILTGYPGDP